MADGAARGTAALAAWACSLAVFGALAACLVAAPGPETRPRRDILTVVRLAAMPAPDRRAPREASRGAPPLRERESPAAMAPVPREDRPGEIRPEAMTAAPPAAPAMAAVQTVERAAPAPAPPPAPAPGDDEPSSAAWDAYQASLWARIAARKPPGVNIPGAALVEFTLDAGGALATIRLARSSGNAMLDRLALRTIRNAGPFPAPPATLRGRTLAFTIRFSFR